VDGFAGGQTAPRGRATPSNDLPEGTADGGASTNAPDGTPAASDASASLNPAATAAQSALVAGWTAVPPSDEDEDGKGRTAGDRAKDEARHGKHAGQTHVVVPAWMADGSLPIPAYGTSNGSGRHTGGQTDDQATTSARKMAIISSGLANAAGTAADAAIDATADRISLSAEALGPAGARAFGAALENVAAQAQTDSPANPANLAAQLAARLTAQAVAGSEASTDASDRAATLASLLKTSATTSRAELGASASVAPAVTTAHLVTYVASTFSTVLASRESATADRASTLPDTTATQIIQAIRLQAMGDGGEAHIRLDPSHFGELTVSVKVEQGQVVARLTAESPAVREWLQANQGLLRASLGEQHLTLNRLEVSEPHEPNGSSSNRRGGGQDAPEGDQEQRRPKQPETDERFEVVA
jgi:flagellar hook-length control protein FliK